MLKKVNLIKNQPAIRSFFIFINGYIINKLNELYHLVEYLQSYKWTAKKDKYNKTSLHF